MRFVAALLIFLIAATAAPAQIQPIPFVAVNAGTSQLQVKSSYGTFVDGYVTTSGAAYIFIFNSASAVTNGSVTAGTAAGDYQDCIYLANAGSQGLSSFGLPTELFSTGIVVAVSSTGCSTLTLANALFIKGRAQ